MLKNWKLIFSTSVLCLGVFAVVADYVDLNYSSSKNREPSSTVSVEKFIHLEKIHLTDFDNRTFLISNAKSFSQIQIINEMKSPVDVVLTCDQNIAKGRSSWSADINSRTFQTGNTRSYAVRLRESENTDFLLGKDVRACELSYQDVRTPAQKTVITLHSELMDFPWLGSFINYRDECDVRSLKLPQLSCIHDGARVETLETPETGFQAKVEMLLGQKPDAAFIANQNPYATLDFSKAPKLKAIFLASLVYRHDFYGTVMARLLKYHAERGTVVYLMTTGYMMLDKDKALLYDLAKTGNFRLQEFKYHDPKHNLTLPFRYIDDKYRDMHIKLLVTLADDDAHNAIVAGGRNIHDGFLFKTKPDLSKFPELVQYGKDDDFVHWNDFEMKISSKELAQVTAAQLLRFWNRDTMTQILEDFFSPGTTAPSQGEHQFRHFISLPYSDNHALEDVYVSLIDNARTSIRISSPYLRPTSKIMDALKRAADRKIDIVIQTRVSLEGDTQAWLYEEVNKESINALYDKMKIYEWKQNSILHSKFILVDGQVAFVGSVNLSRRSFVQDVENGFLIRDPEYVAHMTTIFNSYLTHSAQITERLSRKPFPSVMIKLLQNQF